MRLTRDQVKIVAKLANLPVTQSEEEMYANQLSKILEYIDELQKVDTKGIEPTYNSTGLISVFRPDVSDKSLSQSESLQNASNPKLGFFVTKGVFESE